MVFSWGIGWDGKGWDGELEEKNTLTVEWLSLAVLVKREFSALKRYKKSPRWFCSKTFDTSNEQIVLCNHAIKYTVIETYFKLTKCLYASLNNKNWIHIKVSLSSCSSSSSSSWSHLFQTYPPHRHGSDQSKIKSDFFGSSLQPPSDFQASMRGWHTWHFPPSPSYLSGYS